MNHTTTLCALAIGGLLGISAVDKVVHWALFVFTLEYNPLVPASVAPLLGGGVIAVESLLGALLFIPRSRHVGLFAATLLFGAFTIVIAVMMFAAPGERCGCTFLFGYDRAELRHLVLNALLTLLSGFLWHVNAHGSPAGTERIA